MKHFYEMHVIVCKFLRFDKVQYSIFEHVQANKKVINIKIDVCVCAQKFDGTRSRLKFHWVRRTFFT